MVEQVVELAPGESKVVSFEATPHEARTYQVSVDGLSGSFVALVGVPDIPEGFTISNLAIIPKTAGIGYPVTISIRVTRLNGAVGPLWKFYFHIDNEIRVLELASFALKVGETREFYITYTPTEVGTYQVKIDGLESSFTATELPDVRLTNLAVQDLSPVTPVYGGRIRISNLSIEPSTVRLGEKVIISVVVANYWKGGASARIICKVNSYKIEQSVGFSGGARKLVSFQAIPYVVKTFSVDVSGLTGQFTAM